MFKNDFFSTQKIIWKEIYNNDVNNIINKYLNKKIFKDEIKIYQNDGPELNSKNYKIKINKKYYLLKRWDIIYANKKTKKINPKNILNTIKMLEWINVLKGNLINTKNFLKKKKIIKYKDFYWSIFPFYEGEHYSGSNISFYKVIKTNFAQFILQYFIGKMLPFSRSCISIYPMPFIYLYIIILFEQFPYF